MERRNRRPFAAVIAVAAFGVAIGGAFAQTSAVDEIAKYRAALQDGNPAELWEARGEEPQHRRRSTRHWPQPRSQKILDRDAHPTHGTTNVAVAFQKRLHPSKVTKTISA